LPSAPRDYRKNCFATIGTTGPQIIPDSSSEKPHPAAISSKIVGKSGTVTVLRLTGEEMSAKVKSAESMSDKSSDCLESSARMPIGVGSVSPCFVAGSLIVTARGEVPVEEIVAGDQVLTRDRGYRTVRWAGGRHLSSGDLMQMPDLRPIRIKKGSLGSGLPVRDLLVSPQHRMLITREITHLGTEGEVLVAAANLCGEPGIGIDGCTDVTYHHILFDAHEIICADGAWSESFLPRADALGGLDSRQYSEILRIFPELATQSGCNRFVAAREFAVPHPVKVPLAA
jgi:hypothetical protein